MQTKDTTSLALSVFKSKYLRINVEKDVLCNTSISSYRHEMKFVHFLKTKLSFYSDCKYLKKCGSALLSPPPQKKKKKNK